jgi:hypothetical protein
VTTRLWAAWGYLLGVRIKKRAEGHYTVSFPGFVRHDVRERILANLAADLEIKHGVPVQHKLGDRLGRLTWDARETR